MLSERMRTWRRAWARTILFAWVAVTVAGCGVGYSRGVHSVTMKGDSDVPKSGRSLSYGVHQISLYDESGILVSSGAQAHQKWSARQQAVERAMYRGQKPGEKIEYSYKRVAPALGARSRVQIMFGSSTDGMVLANGTQPAVSGVEMSMFGLRWDMGLKVWQLTRNLALSLELSAIGYSYSTTGSIPSGDKADNEPESHWGTPLQLGAVYRPIPSVSVSGIAGFDPLFSLFSCLGDECQPLWNVGAEVNWKPLDWLGVVALGRRHVATDFGRGVTYWEAFAGVYLMWEPDFWRRARTGNYKRR